MQDSPSLASAECGSVEAYGRPLLSHLRQVVQVISLPTSCERRARFAAMNSHIDFEFFDGIDGAAVSPNLNSRPDLFEPGLCYTPGAVGCALSHLRLWQEAAKTDKIVSVAEDDAVFRHDFHEKSAHVLAHLPDDWDIVLWGWNFDSILSLQVMPDISPAVMVFDQTQMRKSLERFQKLTDAPYSIRLDRCFGTFAYTISPAGARKFISTCFPLKDFTMYFPLLNRRIRNFGIDVAMNSVYSHHESFCTLPPLAVSANEHANSLVQTNR